MSDQSQTPETPVELPADPHTADDMLVAEVETVVTPVEKLTDIVPEAEETTDIEDVPQAEATTDIEDNTDEPVATMGEIEDMPAEEDGDEIEDMPAEEEEVEASAEDVQPAPDTTPITKRVVQIGDSTITLEGTLASKPLDELKTLLSVSVPEMKTGDVSESASNGVSTISVKPRAGSKG